MNRPVLCLDARMASASGIGTYLQGFLGSLKTRTNLPMDICLLGRPSDLPQGPWHIRLAEAPIYSLSEQFQIPLAMRRSKAVLVHSPHYNMPIIDAARTIVTVHDLIHLKFQQFWPSRMARSYARFFFYHVVPRARAIITVSENTKRDLMEMLSIPRERITVTYPGVSQDYFRDIPPDILSEFETLDLPQNYLLYVGNLKEFKNVERLLEAYRYAKSVQPDLPALVLAGRNFIPGFENRIRESKGVRWIGEVKREILRCLYKKALLFLFPSLYEGFGLPPLEAMASGTPVLCSNRASLPEVVGDAAFFVNPENIEELAAGIERLAGSDSLRKELSAKGRKQAVRFSWDRMTDQTLGVYEQCLP
jgi:glycosyltransferase involved in cell wall biosynthesis